MSFSALEMTAFQYWTQLDCPTSLMLYLLGKDGQWAEVLTAKVLPEHFPDDTSYAKANAAVTFLKKNPHVSGSDSASRKAACIASWEDGEASCYRANERLSEFLVHPSQDSMPALLLRRARAHLLSWLGTCPDDETLSGLARHGPGTTFSSSVAAPTAADKYDDVLTLTRGASFYLMNLASTLWMKALIERADRKKVSPLECISRSRGNRFTTVPKTALTDRGIAIECTLNVYFQLAIGRAIRNRLRRRVGWDLDNAARIHRDVAQSASIQDSHSTIDLSNASDSLCKNLVRVLLHDTAWLERMEDLRSTHTFLQGRWHLLEKFSSMGNGYTFELETCVFASLIAACLELQGHSAILGVDFYVFGDDIIVASDVAESVVAVLAWAGFRTNKDKTFLRGPFRESCGGDYYLGAPVRGFYLKTDISYDTQTIYTLHNGAKVIFEACGVNTPWFLDWLRRQYLSTRLRDVGGSSRHGDSVLHIPSVTWKWRHGIRWVKTVQWTKPKTLKWSYWSDTVRLACRLTSAGHSFGIDFRGAYSAVKWKWVSDS